MDFISIFRDLMRCNSLQQFINNRFYDESIFRFDKSSFLHNISFLVTREGTIFRNSPLINNIIARQYNYDGLNEDDIVLVLGACEGDCLVFADKVKAIIAVEPLHTEALKENIRRNSSYNVRVMDCGLGEGKATLQYEGIKKEVQLYSLTEIVIRSGLRPNVLICDVEWWEHCITTQELKQFRIIEMENHAFMGHNLKEMTDKIQDAGFEYNITDHCDTSEIIHAWR